MEIEPEKAIREYNMREFKREVSRLNYHEVLEEKEFRGFTKEIKRNRIIVKSLAALTVVSTILYRGCSSS